MDNKYYAQMYIKNLDKWKEYITHLKAEKGDDNITLEEAVKLKFEWGNKELPTNSH